MRMGRRESAGRRVSLPSLGTRDGVLAIVIALAWVVIASWFSVRFQPARFEWQGGLADWFFAAWIPILVWASFVIASFVDWRTRGGEQQVQGALAAIAIRTGGTGCLVLVIVLLESDEALRNHRLIAIAVVYVLALLVDTGLWLRQVRQVSPE